MSSAQLSPDRPLLRIHQPIDLDRDRLTLRAAYEEFLVPKSRVQRPQPGATTRDSWSTGNSSRNLRIPLRLPKPTGFRPTDYPSVVHKRHHFARRFCFHTLVDQRSAPVTEHCRQSLQSGQTDCIPSRAGGHSRKPHSNQATASQACRQTLPRRTTDRMSVVRLQRHPLALAESSAYLRWIGHAAIDLLAIGINHASNLRNAGPGPRQLLFRQATHHLGRCFAEPAHAQPGRPLGLGTRLAALHGQQDRSRILPSSHPIHPRGDRSITTSCDRIGRPRIACRPTDTAMSNGARINQRMEAVASHGPHCETQWQSIPTGGLPKNLCDLHERASCGARVPRVRMVPGRLASRTSALHQQRTDTSRAFADGPDAAMLRRLVDRLSNRSQFCWTADRCGDASSQRSFRFKGVFQWLNTITAKTQPIGHRIPWDQAVVLRWVSSPAFCCGCQFCTCFCEPSRLGSVVKRDGVQSGAWCGGFQRFPYRLVVRVPARLLVNIFERLLLSLLFKD